MRMTEGKTDSLPTESYCFGGFCFTFYFGINFTESHISMQKQIPLHTYTHISILTHRKTYRHTDRQIDTQTDKKTHRQTETHRQTDGQLLTKGIHAITNGATGEGVVVMTTVQAGGVFLIVSGPLVCGAETGISRRGNKNSTNQK